jgi:hypothetical protein
VEDIIPGTRREDCWDDISYCENGENKVDLSFACFHEFKKIYFDRFNVEKNEFDVLC